VLLREPLDDAEKHRFEEIVLRCSAWVPVTHASVTPLRDVFQTDAPRVARKVRFRNTCPACFIDRGSRVSTWPSVPGRFSAKQDAFRSWELELGR